MTSLGPGRAASRHLLLPYELSSGDRERPLQEKIKGDVVLVAKDDRMGLVVGREQTAPALLLTFAFALMMVDGYDIFNISFLMPLITIDLDLSHVRVGQIFAAGLAGSML